MNHSGGDAPAVSLHAQIPPSRHRMIGRSHRYCRLDLCHQRAQLGVSLGMIGQ
jgi:hypothetical protein